MRFLVFLGNSSLLLHELNITLAIDIAGMAKAKFLMNDLLDCILCIFV